jgi:hypothetical protein
VAFQEGIDSMEFVCLFISYLVLNCRQITLIFHHVIHTYKSILQRCQ